MFTFLSKYVTVEGRCYRFLRRAPYGGPPPSGEGGPSHTGRPAQGNLNSPRRPKPGRYYAVNYLVCYHFQNINTKLLSKIRARYIPIAYQDNSNFFIHEYVTPHQAFKAFRLIQRCGKLLGVEKLELKITYE